jgi:hypothetical protein
MSHKRLALCALLLLASLDALAQLPPMTPEKWRADVDYVGRELPRRHKNAFHHVTLEQFAAAVGALRAKAGQASDDEMLVGLMQITAMVGDGHTRVNLKPAMIHHFPIGFAEIEGVHRVIRGAGPAAALVGGRLTKIDDRPLAEVIARVRTVITQGESELLITARTPNWLFIAEILHGLGVIEDPATARYTAVLDDGREVSADLRALDSGAKPEWRLAAAKQPLYRQRQAESFWYQWLPESSTVYVNFRTYENLRAKSRELWSFVDAHPVQKIAIDLRGNGGGDYHVGRRYLVDELARRPKLRGYVITGANTFSAALKTAIDFRDVARATLVGETIGEKPNSYSENDELTLPHSKLSLSYSTRYYEFQPGVEGLVTPHREILPTWADWVAGRDPVLEWIVGQ